jgi:HSP20 family protein
LSRRSSGDPVRDVGDLVGRFFDDWLSPRMSGQARGWAPAVDMIDRDDEIVLRADLPGLEQKDIEVTVDSGVLTVRGERQEEREAKENDYYCCERWAGNFSRSMMLPPGVDTSGIKATFKNGVLEVHIPKSQQTMQKRIQINAA